MSEEAQRANEGAPFSFMHGVLSYRKTSGEERGREPFWLTSNRDGTKTLRSLSMTDDSHFVRDVTYTLGSDRRPVDAFVRLQVGAELVGLGTFKLIGNTLHVEVRDRHGATSQVLEVPDRFHIITHAVMLDGWSPWPYDDAKGGTQKTTVYNTSTMWNGTDGPLGRIEEILLADQGESEVEVPAGTFACRHFTIDSEVLDVPTSHIYVHGEDSLLVRYDWPEYNLEYVLAETVEKTL